MNEVIPNEEFIAELNSQGWCFPLLSGLTVLESALLAGVSLPSSCRNGSCRTCMCQLLGGSVQYRIDWPSLSSDEKADAWILPCVAVALDDLILDVPYAKKGSI